MAANPTVTVQVRADTKNATAGLDSTAKSLDKVSREARTASDRIDSVGSTAGGTTTGLRDMADAVEMAGFGQLAQSMGVAAVGFEAIDGAATLYATHQKTLTKVVAAFDKVMKILRGTILTNPIFLIAVVIIAIGAAFVLAYKKCEVFRRIVDAVFRAIMSVIKTWWSMVKAIFGFLLNVLKKPFEMWLDHVRRVVGIFKGIFAGIKDAIIKPFQAAMAWLKSHFKLPKLPSWLPGDQGKAAPAGVYVPAPRVGGTGAATRATTGPTIVIQTGIGDPHEIARQIRRLLRDDDARMGRYRPSPVTA